MNDDEFKRTVLERFDALDDQVDRRFAHMDRRLDAIVSRLDEQDLFIERLMDKVDRLNTHMALAAQASEQALDASRRELPAGLSVGGAKAPPR